MTKWTDPRNLRKNDRIQTSDGSKVTLSGVPEKDSIALGTSKVPVITLSGKREGSGEDYKAVVPEGQKVRKVI